MGDIDVEELETFMTDINDFANYGQLVCKSLKEKILCTTSTLRLVNDINNTLKEKVEYLKEHNNLLIDEILEYVNENQSLPYDSNITDEDIIMRETRTSLKPKANKRKERDLTETDRPN